MSPGLAPKESGQHLIVDDATIGWVVGHFGTRIQMHMRPTREFPPPPLSRHMWLVTCRLSFSYANDDLFCVATAYGVYLCVALLPWPTTSDDRGASSHFALFLWQVLSLRSV